MKDGKSGVFFRKSLLGYNKKDVNDFIIRFDLDVKRKLTDNNKEIKSKAEGWKQASEHFQAEIKRLTDENVSLCSQISGLNESMEILREQLQEQQRTNEKLARELSILQDAPGLHSTPAAREASIVREDPQNDAAFPSEGEAAVSALKKATSPTGKTQPQKKAPAAAEPIKSKKFVWRFGKGSR